MTQVPLHAIGASEDLGPLLRVRVEAPDGASLVSVPADEPINVFVADLAEALAVTPADAHWSFGPSSDSVFDRRMSLGELGVRDGDVLVMRRLQPAATSQEFACSLHARTQLTLPARLTPAERAGIALRESMRHGPSHGAPQPNETAADPEVLSLPTRTPLWRRMRSAWAASDYERRLDERITAPRLAQCATIAVLSPKGGPGKTTVTALLGSLLAYLRSDRVIAVDANPDFGSLGRRLTPQHDVFLDDLLHGCLCDSALSAAAFDGALGRGPDGLMVAPAPTDPQRASALDEDAYRALFTRLATFAGALVLDCGTGLDAPPARAALARADQVVLLTDAEPDTASLVWEAATWLRDVAPPLVLVVNKHEPRSELNVETFGQAIPFARGLITIPREDAAATLLRSGRFSWSQAAPGWRIRVRELAALLTADWPGLGLEASRRR
ncbi:MinD-like ATPase involved in chromosome partitioning or flagellar assembly [Solirubrobacter pauli]|uniref:MinD-like ATPase involved in chromosome partitioning or flagellar assembly n=1 Tax=Solirubrobacter pauli TaxID=166793 RepID=A0A660LAC0_9ACTN|nr:EsaB/YukD family protein [Solirubrobacter pauli]RKQ90813.1 MinD-like ATPase involved in chromosome partitioning or flagellar assembly [Solirubrobacter pauli]